MQERCLTDAIQDECRSDAYQKKGLCKFTIPVEQLFAQDNGAVLEPQLEFQRDCWSTSKLTPARRLQLADLMFKIYHQAAWMGNLARSPNVRVDRSVVCQQGPGIEKSFGSCSSCGKGVQAEE